MKKILFASISGAIIIALLAFTFLPGGEDFKVLEIGKKAPMSDFVMQGVSGKEYTLNNLNKEAGLLVVFSCNTCPFVVGRAEKEGWEGRYAGIYDNCTKNNIGMVLVNSNEAKRKDEDSMDEMKKHAKEKAYQMAYVIDANHQLADAFGARTTPHVYLFDKDLNLVYRGLIDDNVASSKEVKVNHLANAIASLSEGVAPDPATTSAMGCSIKRVVK
jgi:hypothetical protein